MLYPFGRYIGRLFSAGQAIGGLVPPSFGTGSTNVPGKFVILAGQSNATGQGLTSELSAAHLFVTASYPNVVIHRDKYATLVGDPITWLHFADEPVQPRDPASHGGARTTFGCELTLARLLDTNSPGQNWSIAGIAMNGSGMQDNWSVSASYPVNDNGDGNLFAQMCQYSRDWVSSSSLAGTNTVLNGMVWMQGENDSQTTAKAAKYAQELGDMLAGMRAQLGAFPFVYSRYGAQQTASVSTAGSASLRSQQLYASTILPWTTMVDTDDVTTNGSGGGLHFDAEGQYMLGARFGQALLSASQTTTLSVSLVASTASIQTSAAYSYALNITNGGANPASSVNAWVLLPPGSAYVSTSGAGWTATPSGSNVAVLIQTASLAPGAGPQVTINLTAPGSIGNSAVSASANLVASNVQSLSAASSAIPLTLAPATQDATSLKFIPQSRAEYTTLGLLPPSSIWPMQETTGSLIDANGIVNLAPTGTLLNYRGTVPGWSSKAIGILSTSTGINGGWKNTTTVPAPQNPGSSMAALFYLQPNVATGSNAGFVEYQSGGSLAIRYTTTGLSQLRMNGGTTNGTHQTSGSVHAWMITWDRTGRNAAAYSDLDKMIGVFGDITGIGFSFGSTFGNASVSSSYVYGALWTGSDAETFTSGNVKSMMTTLGWTVGWT